MKIITLNESQFNRLFENNGDSTILNGNDTTSKFSSEVSNQANITTPDGDEKPSNPITTNKFAKQQTPQQWGSISGRKSTNTI